MENVAQNVGETVAMPARRRSRRKPKILSPFTREGWLQNIGIYGREGFVYIAVSECGTIAKIGMTTDPWERFSCLDGQAKRRFGKRTAMRLLALTKTINRFAVEEFLIKKFCDPTGRGGDWLAPTEELISISRKMRSVSFPVYGICKHAIRSANCADPACYRPPGKQAVEKVAKPKRIHLPKPLRKKRIMSVIKRPVRP